MTKIISLLAKKFPPGTYAMHAKLHYCRVMRLEDDGIHCVIKVSKQSPRGSIFKTYDAALSELEEVQLRLPDPKTGTWIEIPMDE